MIIKHNIFNIGGKIIKDDEFCLVRENNELDDMTIYSYILYKNKSTKLFKYQKQDSVYIFVGGNGIFEMDKEVMYVAHNDMILVSQNTCHKIINNGDIHMRFLLLKEKVKHERK